MTTSRILLNSCSESWQSIIPYVPKSVVFLDSPCAESLHWSVGARTLFEAGASNIKELSSFESCTSEQKKAVFIVSGQLRETTEEIIEDIVKSSYFQYCILITTLPESLHQHLTGDATAGGGDGSARFVFREFKKKMSSWMRHKSPIYEADVVYAPLSVACVSPSLFFMPAFTSLYPLLDTDLAVIKAARQGHVDRKPPETLSDVDINILPGELKEDLKMLVSSLSCLCEGLQVNEDIYALGHTSRMIAGELAPLMSAKARRKAAPNRASLLIIDRSLDMVGPTAHGRDSFADRMLAALPPLDGHTCDVAVCMSALCSSGSQYNPGVLVPGCLAHPQDLQSQTLLQTFITSKQKESLMDVNRRVVETITRQKLPFDPSVAKIGRINAESLQAHLQHFKSNPTAFRNACPLLQVATACIQTLTSPTLSRWDNLQTTEKILLQTVGEGNGPSIVSLILDLLQNQAKQSRCCTLEETLLLLIHAYSLVGEDATYALDEESQLRKLLSHQIACAPEDSEVVKMLVGEHKSEASAQKAATGIIAKLKAVCRARNHLQKLTDIFHAGSMTRPASYTPLVKRVMEDIFDPAKPELVDIEYKSSGFRDLIKTGFRLFMNVGKPRPSDHPLLLVFIVGGVTCTEVKIVKDTVSSMSPSTQVIVGGTRVLKTTDTLELIFGQEALSFRL